MWQRSSWRQFSEFCAAVWMASGALLWFGETMSAVPLRSNKSASAVAVRSVTVLGATGSIGDSTLDLVRGGRERYRVEALTGNSNVEGLAKLAREFDARFVAVADPSKLGKLKDALCGTQTECGAGESAVIEAAARPADWVMAAVSGAAGLKPALAAVDRGATVALANKECLVCAGDFFMQRAAKAGACILPADSEHNALFQALSSGNREELLRVIITASGGPFRTWAAADIEQATLDQALKHPNWSMGQKITIDSASMMNKGLEVIEASYLFALAPDEIDVLVHPQSIIHGMVEFSDCSVVAQLGAPDMRTPIAHCLGWPDRIKGPAAKLDLAKIGQLSFEAPDFERFPALRIAYEALRSGGGATTVFNAANEVAVAAFIAGKIRFGAIARLVEATIEGWIRSGNLAPLSSADDAIAVDHSARNKAASLLPQIALKAS
jgi:1-deoxy-D-xylulose-5-phosphate reductoisomerase